MSRITHIWLVMLLMSSFATTLLAQNQTLKVVTRVEAEQKEYRFLNEFLLEINAEKAEINIRVTEGNVVKLTLEQSAKNVDVNVAKRDLNFIHFVEKKERNRLYLNNYAQLDAGSTALSSIINNRYTIEVPRHCHLKIKNELGQVSVSGLNSSARFDLSYCSLKISDMKGKLYVDSRIGDVVLDNSVVNGEFMTENVSLKINRSGGSFDILSKFGDLSCLMSEQVSLLNAGLEQCEATLINRTNVEYDYAIEVNNGEIRTLDELLGEQVATSGRKTSLHSKGNSAAGTVIIKSDYSDVNLY